jgi:exodeoxyribonuclease-3
MKIVSWNVNGIRSVSRYGFFEWLNDFQPEIVGLQEIKADQSQVPTHILSSNYHLYTNSAEKKGYSGVAVYSKIKPTSVENKIGYKRFDSEGRFLKLNYDKFSLINVYIPNGGRDQAHMEYKLDFYDYFIDYLEKLKNENIILMGDFNVAHKEIDLARPKENEKNVMFTLPERERISNLIDMGYIDTFRYLNKEPGHYSWWAYYRNLRERNIGWRIDYVFVSKPMAKNFKEVFILKDVKGSDHCPVGIASLLDIV